MKDLTIKDVDVLGHMITAAKDKEGVIWVGVHWVCDALDMSEGQIKRQIKNIQKDLVYSEGGYKTIPLPTNAGTQEVICIRNDFIPIWLARITITKKTANERPDFAGRLLEYQLKAKDILAQAFLPNTSIPKNTGEQIQLLAQGITEIYQKIGEMQTEVDEVKENLDGLKMDLPLLPIEADKITNAVHARGVKLLGGKKSKAYQNKSVRQRLYTDLYSNLKHNFYVGSYKSLKRSQLDMAIAIVEKYEPPVFISEMIQKENGRA